MGMNRVDSAKKISDLILWISQIWSFASAFLVYFLSN